MFRMFRDSETGVCVYRCVDKDGQHYIDDNEKWDNLECESDRLPEIYRAVMMNNCDVSKHICEIMIICGYSGIDTFSVKMLNRYRARALNYFNY